MRTDTDTVLVPHAVQVDGQIITVYDPRASTSPSIPSSERLDRRWVECPAVRRSSPVAKLTASALGADPRGQRHGIYLAPLQMQANNGVLVIDDFGRQVLTPEQLLNRWIVPLDRGIDYLSLSYGFKFTIPCIPKIVFSTNLQPQALGDEAFFRRIKSKVLIPPIGDAQFDEVLRRVSEHRAGGGGPGRGGVPPAGCPGRRATATSRPYLLPNSVCEIVESICDYEGTPKILDRAMVDRVASLYFTHNRAMTATGELGPIDPAELTISVFFDLGGRQARSSTSSSWR